LISGYALAASLDEDVWRRAVESVISGAKKTGGVFDIEALAGPLKLPSRDAARLVSGISSTLAILTQTGASADQFVELAKKGTLPATSARAAFIAA
jgi:hypothetical protein